MGINKYIGSRYVPIYIGIHDSSIEYEALSIVSNAEKTETFTSKQHVPTGVSLNNETYWTQSGFSNAGLEIEVDNAPVVSTDESELMIEKTKSGYLLTLSDSNSFDCGGDYGVAYTLNTMYDVGRYIIKPSICAGVPDEISSIDNPAELIIAEFTEIGDNIMKQYQKITAFDDDNAASFIRFHDGNKWGDWKMIGVSGGSYVLPVATGDVLGGVKIGKGIAIDGDGVISAKGIYNEAELGILGTVVNRTLTSGSITLNQGWNTVELKSTKDTSKFKGKIASNLVVPMYIKSDYTGSTKYGFEVSSTKYSLNSSDNNYYWNVTLRVFAEAEISSINFTAECFSFTIERAANQ